ncbi:PREDICTED: trimeric intracellular cation channel type B [Nanorana parkeri]|uniref:trimeric intracellular cation channel type B n=1 Tax=Nanorana parkeri TaxID=125878 RepID=UPI000853F679|nr:PREDICTED: trimeric intracellular cation channel type B [Nanorana parkeri]
MELITELSVEFSRLSMFPFFDGAHYLVSVLSAREQAGAVDVASRSPMASWFSAMLCCFGGGILSSLMLAEPPIVIFSNSTNIIFASVIWYMVYYFPHDLVYRIFSFLPLRVAAAAMKEVTRTWKILSGITQAHSRFKDAWLVMIANGWAKAAGGGLISNFEQLVRGVWKPENNELLKMSFPVKVSLFGAVLFTLQQIQVLPIARYHLMFIYTMFLITTKVTMMITRTSASPFQPFENVMSRWLFELQKAPTAAEKRPLANDKVEPEVKEKSDKEVDGEKNPDSSGTTRKRSVKKVTETD